MNPNPPIPNCMPCAQLFYLPIILPCNATPQGYQLVPTGPTQTTNDAGTPQQPPTTAPETTQPTQQCPCCKKPPKKKCKNAADAQTPAPETPQTTPETTTPTPTPTTTSPAVTPAAPTAPTTTTTPETTTAPATAKPPEEMVPVCEKTPIEVTKCLDSYFTAPKIVIGDAFANRYNQIIQIQSDADRKRELELYHADLNAWIQEQADTIIRCRTDHPDRIVITKECNATTTTPAPTIETIPWVGQNNSPPETPQPAGPFPTPTTPPDQSPRQYTPDHAPTPWGGTKHMHKWTKEILQNPKVKNHGIYGTPDWITPKMFQDAKWDGTIFEPIGKTQKELCDFYYPGGVLRGIEDLYNKTKPFKDETNPTIAEIDNWCLLLFNQVRVMSGLPPFRLDQNLFYHALWSEERWGTDIWDARYPNDINYPKRDICTVKAQDGSHCGNYFFPYRCNDQLPYLLPGDTCAISGGGIEGIGYVRKDTPWSYKLAERIGGWICDEGYYGGHANPLFTAATIGWTLSPFTIGGFEYIRFRAKYNNN